MRSFIQSVGNISLESIPQYRRNLDVKNIFRDVFPNLGVSPEVARWRRKNVAFAFPGFLRYLRSRVSGSKYFVGSLYFSLLDSFGKETDFGLVSLDLITDVGAAHVVNSFLGTATLSSMRYHGLGSSNSSLLVTNTALATELSSQYATTNVRVAGTVAAGDTANILVSTGITAFTGTVSCKEWGLFSQASTLTGTPVGGTMFDRATFATQNVLATFSAKTIFTLTVASGS